MTPGSHVARATNFCTVAPNICGFSVWNVRHGTLLAPKIFRWLLDFWKICGPVRYTFVALWVFMECTGTTLCYRTL
jgi:hypothetical protein